MPFQQPITIARALHKIARNEFVLPAIQREFVWETEQICMLFDSLMRGYPFGSFLFWKVEKQNTRKYAFYGFVTNYHERDAPHCPTMQLMGDDMVTAVLDGQQRLTALNIGLRGSHAEKLPRKRWSNPHAFPKKQLYLDVLSSSGDGELGMKHEFAFLGEHRAKTENGEGERHWFPVSKILDMDAGPGLFGYLTDAGLAGNKGAYAILYRLHQVIHSDLLINYYEEEDQDLDKVLNIFIRVNSGGTVLSYADLLLSIATAQWRERDAREEIYALVDDLNKTRNGFAFPKDMVLKAALLLTDIPDVRFKVTNFDADNMGTIEARWDAVSRALRVAVELLASFGFSSQNLTANNVVLPLAYYVIARALDDSYLSSPKHADDRERARLWTVRTLVKRGIWGSGLDTMLQAMRGAIRAAVDANEAGFPVERLEAAMRARGKSLSFEDEELDDLLDLRYGKRGLFALLSLLYPGGDLRNDFHVDHVYPRSLMKVRTLRKAGISDQAQLDELTTCVDMLPNLQLMEGGENLHKSDKLPQRWLELAYPEEHHLGHYLARHDLGDALPGGPEEFMSFFVARRERMKARLQAILGVKHERAREA